MESSTSSSAHMRGSNSVSSYQIRPPGWTRLAASLSPQLQRSGPKPISLAHHSHHCLASPNIERPNKSIMESFNASSSSLSTILHHLPSTYAVCLDACASPDSLDHSFHLRPSTVPEKLHTFLELCNKKEGLIAYDEVLYDDRLKVFADAQVGHPPRDAYEIAQGLTYTEGATEFMVMMYKFFTDPCDDEPSHGFDTEDDVMDNWVKYVVVFVNRHGYLCEYTFEDGGRVKRVKWEYTEECYLKAISVLGYGLYRFPGLHL
ncbi:hypothetical protein BJ508DRAFT_307625 [Ascobolus immersus RN42]|uniref:Uncharacterized protein n=1 Tax=Ascobolus immersus RN42 TaxID=1160509 RepID=A0A3N4I7T5_ASCIM|nr:hypothetical protein BJ508DRAFT_307625 [Ascobolus immersus RN42]